MNINLVWDASVGAMSSSLQSSFETAVSFAASYFDSLITTPYDITINVGWGEITQGSATPLSNGGAEGGPDDLYQYSYQDVVSALQSHENSIATLSAYSSLPPTDPTSGSGVLLSILEADALGLTTYGAGTTGSGSVGFAADGSYNFDTTNRAVSGKADFVGIAEHEIAHALDRISPLAEGSGWGLLDLFRYVSAGALATDGAQTSYFSVDGGVTALKNFGTTANDPSDWSNSGPNAPEADSFNAFYSLGVVDPVTTIDEEVMNILGFSEAASGVTGATVQSGQNLLVSAGNSFTGSVISGGGSITILSGGMTADSSILSGAIEAVSAGGVTSGAVVTAGGLEVVSGGGVSEAVQVAGSGIETVASAGSATDTVVSSGGTLIASSGAIITSLSLLSGG